MIRSPASRRRRIAVLVESSRQYGRMLAQGIARYADERGDWTIFFEKRHLDSRLPSWIDTWDGDGVLIHSDRLDYVRRLVKSGLAVVSLYKFARRDDFSEFHQDNRAIAELAVQYFLAKGFRNFAFCGIRGASYSSSREAHASAALAPFGCGPASFSFGKREMEDAFFRRRRTMGGFVKWLRRLPKPLALFCCNDDVASLVIFTCGIHGIRVPDDIAVLGVDYDPVSSCLAHPHLSSVETNAVQIGYEAAGHLEYMLSSGNRKPRERVFAPVRIVENESTDVFVVDDPLVKAALSIMRQEDLRSLSVEILAGRLDVCRTTLDNRFRRSLRCPVHRKLLEFRLARSLNLLEGSSQSLDRIAAAVGFTTSHYCRAFRKMHGQSPGAYRACHIRG